ncbi:MAG TPA: hypothetical protein P5341_08625 [Hyphomonas sp.]|nr:hypothetical protein [Hyphomonas sp.]
MLYDRAAQRGRQATAKSHVWPCPTGWVSNRALLAPGPLDAEVMDNFFPTAQGCRLRGGKDVRATLEGAVTALMTYKSGSQETLIGADASGLYDISSPADPEVAEAPVLGGMTSGDWSGAQFETSGGVFYWMVNGADNGAIYDGSDFNPVADEAINDLDYDALVTDFEVGETVTGGNSGATATIFGVVRTTATTGTLKIGTVAGGPFQNNEPLTSASGAATEDGTVSAASTLAISGADTSAMSFVWAHKNRLWFVENGQLSAWYLAVNTIAGTITEFPLAGVFRLGGSLLFGGVLSSDSGAGMDDRQVFVTTEGEFAVYEGNDPGSNFVRVGVYRIGRPLGKNAWFISGGDVVVATENGLVSLMQAMAVDRAGLTALTFDVEDYWQQAVAQRASDYAFSCTIWPTRTMLIVGVPDLMSGVPAALVCNTTTGRWGRYVGWDVQCAGIFEDRLYFGSADGAVYEAEATGTDAGVPYFGAIMPKASEFRSTAEKAALHARAIVRHKREFQFRLTGATNYATPTTIKPEPTSEEAASVWGTAVWGTAVWGAADETVTKTEWQTVTGVGFALSAMFEVGSGTTVVPAIEPVMIELRYEAGNSL